MNPNSIEIFFSLAFLLLTYFMTSVALIHVYIPGAIQKIRRKDGKIAEKINFARIYGPSLVLAILFTYLMFNFFISPTYQFS